MVQDSWLVAAMSLTLFCALCGGRHDLDECRFALTPAQRSEWRQRLWEFFPELAALLDAEDHAELN